MFGLRRIPSSIKALPFCRSIHVESRLDKLGIKLEPASPPKGNYVSCVRTGNLLFLSGHLPYNNGKLITGKVGQDLSVEDGYNAAKAVCVGLLSTLKAELGDLDKVKRVVKVTGMVNAVPTFTEHPKVINGCSDLLVDAFLSQGKHARVAAGYGSLPLNVACEVDLVVEVE